ncbi:RutC family protein [Colletotrichum tropicale]|nr:RutC family protein [Colletotrichum tropicale]
MSHLTYYTYQGFGSDNLKSHAYNQAVRMENQIFISGQGGHDRVTGKHSRDIDEHIDQAFENVDFVLRDAGGKGWERVFIVRSYHIHLTDEAQAAMVRNFKNGCQTIRRFGPVWGLRDWGRMACKSKLRS